MRKRGAWGGGGFFLCVMYQIVLYCTYMFADDANTGNRRGYCHFPYWKTSVPLTELIHYMLRSWGWRLVSITGGGLAVCTVQSKIQKHGRLQVYGVVS